MHPRDRRNATYGSQAGIFFVKRRVGKIVCIRDILNDVEEKEQNYDSFKKLFLGDPGQYHLFHSLVVI